MDSFPFGLGTFTRGSKQISGCANPVFEGQISTHNGFVRCHVKLLDEPGFIVESICAWALREAGLPTPEPYWVHVHRKNLPKDATWPFGEEHNKVCFGTKTIVGARTFRRTSSYDPKAELLKWSHCINAATFDEAVANDDRDTQNILTDGRNYWLIDHGRAFANTYRNLDDLSNTTPLFTNTLLNLLATQSISQRIKTGEQIKSTCGKVIASLRSIPFSALSQNDELSKSLKFFLDSRLEQLIDLCISKLQIGTLGLEK